MITFYNVSKIDLHGYDKDYALVMINDFIYDNFIMKNERIIIIHGNGQNILKKYVKKH